MGRLLDKEHLLAHLQGPEERDVGTRIVDAAEAALKREQPVATDFLDPFAQTVGAGILGSISEISYKAFGGYGRAERKRYSVFPHYYLTELVDEPVAVLEIIVRGTFAKPQHRDFLGALLSTGLTRGKIGDIIVMDEGAQVIVAREVAEFVQEHLDRVGNASVTVVEIDPERLAVEPERVREIRTTVPSMRLDAVAGSGFGTSRSKIARVIKADQVKVNWQSVTNPARTVEVGDVISMRGRGRVIVEEMTGTTKKGRLGLLLKRLS